MLRRSAILHRLLLARSRINPERSHNNNKNNSTETKNLSNADQSSLSSWWDTALSGTLNAAGAATNFIVDATSAAVSITGVIVQKSLETTAAAVSTVGEVTVAGTSSTFNALSELISGESPSEYNEDEWKQIIRLFSDEERYIVGGIPSSTSPQDSVRQMISLLGAVLDDISEHRKRHVAGGVSQQTAKLPSISEMHRTLRYLRNHSHEFVSPSPRSNHRELSEVVIQIMTLTLVSQTTNRLESVIETAEKLLSSLNEDKSRATIVDDKSSSEVIEDDVVLKTIVSFLSSMSLLLLVRETLCNEVLIATGTGEIKISNSDGNVPRQTQRGMLLTSRMAKLLPTQSTIASIVTQGKQHTGLESSVSTTNKDSKRNSPLSLLQSQIGHQQLLADITLMQHQPTLLLPHKSQYGNGGGPNPILPWDQLKTSYIGQRPIINSIQSHFMAKKRGVVDENKPSVLLFFGPSGLGKSELAKQVAIALHGDTAFKPGMEHGNKNDEIETSGKLVVIHLTSYCTKEAIYSLVDPPAAHVGEGMLLTSLRKEPDAVVVLDEFEKSTAESIQHLWLSAFQKDGMLRSLKDSSRSISTRKVTFILTCNLCDDLISSTTAEYEAADDVIKAKLRDMYISKCKDAVKKQFGEPFLNRIDFFLPFVAYTPEEKKKFVSLRLSQYAAKQFKGMHRRLLVPTPTFVESIASNTKNFHTQFVEEEAQRALLSTSGEVPIEISSKHFTEYEHTPSQVCFSHAIANGADTVTFTSWGVPELRMNVERSISSVVKSHTNIHSEDIEMMLVGAVKRQMEAFGAKLKTLPSDKPLVYETESTTASETDHSLSMPGPVKTPTPKSNNDIQSERSSVSVKKAEMGLEMEKEKSIQKAAIVSEVAVAKESIDASMAKEIDRSTTFQFEKSLELITEKHNETLRQVSVLNEKNLVLEARVQNLIYMMTTAVVSSLAFTSVLAVVGTIKLALAIAILSGLALTTLFFLLPNTIRDPIIKTSKATWRVLRSFFSKTGYVSGIAIFLICYIAFELDMPNYLAPSK